MNYVIQPLEASLEAAFLEWRSNGQAQARGVIERELRNHRSGQSEILVATLMAAQPEANKQGRPLPSTVQRIGPVQRVGPVQLGTVQLIGTVQLVFEHDDPDLADGQSRAYVQALEVRPEYRRQGLGRALMRHLEPMAMRRGFSVLTLMVEPHNHAALELYRDLGYVVFKDSSWHWQGRDYPTLCLEKVI